MKLLVKTSLYYAIASLAFFVIAGFIIRSNFNHIISNHINDFLINREEIATTQIINDVPISSLNNYEQTITVTQNQNEVDVLKLNDTIIYDIIDDQFRSFRELNVTRKIGSTYYNISILKSLFQSKLLVIEILKSMSLVFAGLLVFLIFSNLLISRDLWKPFKNTLATLEEYELGSTKTIDFTKTNTQEFNQLNRMLNVMTKKIHYDYLNLKEFTENAAHEIQTPLTIIRNKCELLMQSEKLNEDELVHTKVIYNNCLRLSKINRGLALLAKIESGEYVGTKEINISEIVRTQIDQYIEVIELNEISLTKDIKDDIYYGINPNLIEILISNLIRNAIKHNISNGTISIKTTNNKINISNSGAKTKINTNQFNRFKRSNKNSFGLGLSIISKICKVNNIKLIYSYDDGMHSFDLVL